MLGVPCLLMLSKSAFLVAAERISEKWQKSAEGLDEPTISPKVSFGSEKILQMLLGSNALYVANLPVRVVTQQAGLAHQTLPLPVPVGRISMASADPKQ